MVSCRVLVHFVLVACGCSVVVLACGCSVVGVGRGCCNALRKKCLSRLHPFRIAPPRFVGDTVFGSGVDFCHLFAVTNGFLAEFFSWLSPRLYRVVNVKSHGSC